MINHGDLSRPCVVQVIDEYRRPWRRAFRKTPVYRLVFSGFIKRVEYASGGTMSLELEDPWSRYSRNVKY